MIPEQAAALEVARTLVRAGVPLFLGHPDAARPTGYALPPGWQRSVPDETVVDAWAPGMALCAVTGHVLDLIDLDPRSGGELPTASPVTYVGRVRTPSGGTHLWVTPLEVESRDGVWPGVDVKSGTPDGRGRGFGFLPPTVRASKVDGKVRPYGWAQAPPAGMLKPPDGRRTPVGGLAEVRQQVLTLRDSRSEGGEPRRLGRSAAAREWGRACEQLTEQIRGWSARGWGGEAHAGLLEATKHLVLLAPDHAEAGYLSAFRQAGIEPDEGDLAKLESALAKYSDRADAVVPDEELGSWERFEQGVVPPFGPAVVGNTGNGGQNGHAPPAGRRGSLTRDRAEFAFYDETELDALEPPGAVVDGLLYRGTVARLFGPSNVGKTLVALDLAAHVANGMPWRGRSVKTGPGVYVYAEGAPSAGHRLRWWRTEHERPSGLLVWPEAVQIGGPRWDAFGAACQAAGAATVWLDTLRACTVGRAENDNDDMAYVMAALRELAEGVGACVTAVHHNGWAAEGRARGASAVLAALDTELELTDAGSGTLLLVTRKQRDAERAAPVALRLRKAHGGVVVGGPAEGGADYFAERKDVAAQAHLAALQAHEAAGWRPPAQLGVRELVRVLREELNREGDEKVMRRAAHLFKAAHGQPVNLTESD